MGVDINLILPNDCKDIMDNEYALAFFKDALNRVTAFFGGRREFVTEITIYNSDSIGWEEYDVPEYSFTIPLISATYYLKRGYWEVFTGDRYCFYFWPYPGDVDRNGNPYIGARYNCFNAARIMGFSEGWICDYFHSWNCPLGDVDSDFGDWLRYGEDEEDAIVHEYSMSIFGDEFGEYNDYASKYHDTFKECFDLLESFERDYPEYRVLTIGCPDKEFTLVSDGNSIFMVDADTGMRLSDFPIEKYLSDPNGEEPILFPRE